MTLSSKRASSYYLSCPQKVIMPSSCFGFWLIFIPSVAAAVVVVVFQTRRNGSSEIEMDFQLCWIYCCRRTRTHKNLPCSLCHTFPIVVRNSFPFKSPSSRDTNHLMLRTPFIEEYRQYIADIGGLGSIMTLLDHTNVVIVERALWTVANFAIDSEQCCFTHTYTHIYIQSLDNCYRCLILGWFLQSKISRRLSVTLFPQLQTCSVFQKRQFNRFLWRPFWYLPKIVSI